MNNGNSEAYPDFHLPAAITSQGSPSPIPQTLSLSLPIRFVDVFILSLDTALLTPLSALASGHLVSHWCIPVIPVMTVMSEHYIPGLYS